MSQLPPRRAQPRTLRVDRRREVQAAPLPRRRHIDPQQLNLAPLVIVAGFAAVSLLGALLLATPMASSEREWTAPIDAFFVSISAVCVTGLTPVDTAAHWSGFGKVVLLLLMQFGGLGFMTSATLAFLLLGSRVGLRDRMLLSQSLDVASIGSVVTIIKRALIFTFVFELAGFIILSLHFLRDNSAGQAMWFGLFHSVSAFNNAGFDLMGNFLSLEERDHPVVLLTVSVLVIAGGLGFLIVDDLVGLGRRRLRTDTKVVLGITVFLLALGMLLFTTFEWDGALASLTTEEKLLHGWFHSVTPRSAGFNSLPLAEMKDETNMVTMLLMFVGASSGSTGGGIKIGTVAVLLAATMAAVRGREHPEIAGREIRRGDTDRALAVGVLAAIAVSTVTLALARLESIEFDRLLFEAVSAFGTVGLSLGVTPQLSDASLLLLAFTMFAGRLGPITLVLALMARQKRDVRRLPEERIRIG